MVRGLTRRGVRRTGEEIVSYVDLLNGEKRNREQMVIISSAWERRRKRTAPCIWFTIVKYQPELKCHDR